ncbi:MAG: hypothetical protein J0M34_00710 [Alphaproteobacteria bacterium]|nr:hypothetical protein [Alphaproteobacteria bacterium]
MKITIIDQSSNTIHELAESPPPPAQGDSFTWFDPQLEAAPFAPETPEICPSAAVRFPDGRVIEVDQITGELAAV